MASKAKQMFEGEDTIYEVVHDLRIHRGSKIVTLTRGDEVRKSELEPGDDASLLSAGVLRDPAAPINGTTVDHAHDRLLSVAQKLGLVTVKGSEYSLGTKKAKGITAFRKAVTLDELEAAIVEFATAEKPDTDPKE